MLEVKVPVFPESVSEGTIAAWHKKKGDAVEEGEIIGEIETDKVMMEIPATTAGVIDKINKQPGDTVHSQEVIALLSKSTHQDSSPKKATDTTDSKKVSSEKSLTIKAPVFPESVTEGTVATWHKNIGDMFETGEIMVEVETDKVMMEVPATISGILAKKVKK